MNIGGRSLILKISGQIRKTGDRLSVNSGGRATDGGLRGKAPRKKRSLWQNLRSKKFCLSGKLSLFKNVHSWAAGETRQSDSRQGPGGRQVPGKEEGSCKETVLHQRKQCIVGT